MKFCYGVAKSDSSSPRMLESVMRLEQSHERTGEANKGVICEELVDDIFTISGPRRSVFIFACISVYHVKH